VLEKIWGAPLNTDWGIGYIVLSDYMNFENPSSLTVISCVITLHNKSSILNTTPDDINNKNIIINEVFRQLKTIHKNLPKPTYSIMSENYYNYDKKKWVSYHTAFMNTIHGYLDWVSPKFNNLLACGVQNGNSTYSFTSMESSVINAIALVHKLIPISMTEFQIENGSSVRSNLFLFMIIIMIIIYCFFKYKYIL